MALFDRQKQSGGGRHSSQRRANAGSSRQAQQGSFARQSHQGDVRENQARQNQMNSGRHSAQENQAARHRRMQQTGSLNQTDQQEIPMSEMAPATEATGSYADLAAQDTRGQKLGPVVIALRKVSKVYPAQPQRPALNNISLDIRAGEFLFLVGHSGSGKSTFIRMLNREIVPTSGELIVAGENLRTIRNWRIPYLRRNVGCVFQDFKLLPNKTAFENVAFALEVIGKSRHVIKTQVPEALRLVGLEEKMEKLPDQLSGGEQQRVSIARSIVNRPPLLICDEPTGNLDPQTSLGIMRLLERINSTGTTVLIATHDREMVDQMRRRVLALENGVLVRDQKKGVYGYDV